MIFVAADDEDYIGSIPKLTMYNMSPPVTIVAWRSRREEPIRWEWRVFDI